MAIIKGQPTPGNDDIVADGANDTIDALAGNDRVDGGAGNDTLLGNTGNDVLIGGTGNNTLDGGEGNDQVVETGNVNFTLTNDKLMGIGTNRLISIEGATLLGGAGNNIIDTTKFTGPVTLFGGIGNDRLLGGDGNDTLVGELGSPGGSGNDILDGGAGNDRVVELSDVNFTLTDDQLIGSGTDKLISIENAALTGGSSDNIFDASKFKGSVSLTGNLGNDTLIGGISNADRVIETGNFNYTLTNNSLTGEGTDRLSGIETASLVGGTGNNIIDASKFKGSVILNGGGPVDPFTGDDRLTGGSSKDLISGGDGNDILSGNEGNDTLNGGDGNDFFRGQAGNDILNGGAGVDRVEVLANTGNIILTDNSVTGDGTDALNSIETATLFANNTNRNIDASSFTLGSVTLDGSSLDNILLGGSGNDFFDGEDGNDTLNAGVSGLDTLSGGAGNDTYIVTGTSDTVIENFNAGLDTVQSGSSFTLSANVENLTLTGGITGTGNALSNFIIGSDGTNILSGGGGNDIILGSLGDDSLNGGDNDDFLLGDNLFGSGVGNDTLTGGLGNDTLGGGAGFDQVVESGNVSFTLTKDKLIGNGTDSHNSIESARLTGGAGNNFLDTRDFDQGSVFLDGGAGNDFLFSGIGDDSLFGGFGNDRLGGGFGNDLINGGADIDTLSESGDVNFFLSDDQLIGLGTDDLFSIEKASLNGGFSGNIMNAFNFRGSVFLDGGGGDDVLDGGAGSDNLNGGFSGNDTIFGNGGNDFLNGDTGNDNLFGGFESDVLNGGGFGTNNNELDALTGGTGADNFVLGNDVAPSYLGVGFATIFDFSIGEGDKIFVTSTSGLKLTLGNTDGDAAPDTIIQSKFGASFDLTAVVRDVNIIGADVFINIPISPNPF